MDISPKLRKKFPVLRQGIYANTAADGPWHENLFEWRQGHELDLLIGASEHFGQGLKVIKKSRENLALFFGCEPHQVALIPNFSLGINLLLSMIPNNQKVLLIEEDYPSVNWPFEKRDFPIEKIKAGEYLEEEIYSRISKGGIDILAISIVQWLSGALLDLEFISKLKAEFPKLTIIADGTQFCGMFPFKFDGSGIDVLIASGYKWMLSGYGNGFMLFDEHFMKNNHPKTIGFGSVRGNLEERGSIPFCNYFEPGHLDSLALGSMGVSLDFIMEIGMDLIGQKNTALSKKFLELSHGTDFLADWVSKRRSHSTIFNIRANQQIFEELKRNNVICAPRGGGVRLSFHFFNTESELEAIFEILKK